MPLHILTVIALLSAAHQVQGIQVAASSSNLGAPASDAEAAASLKGRFLRSSASAQDLVKSKEPAQLDDISHGQESLVALSGDSSSSDAEAAASLKDRFLPSSGSEQDLVKSKEPVQLDDVAHGQESLVALSGDSPSSDAEAAASLKGRFLRSSASAFPLLVAKHHVLLTDIVWLPQQHKLVLIAVQPAMFNRKKRGYGLNRSWSFPDKLQNPLVLEEGLRWNDKKALKCWTVPTRSGDANIDRVLWIMHCLLENSKEPLSRGRVQVENHEIVLSFSKLAASGTGLDWNRGRVSRVPGSVSVALKMIRADPSELFLESMMRYYMSQGVSHVYVMVLGEDLKRRVQELVRSFLFLQPAVAEKVFVSVLSHRRDVLDFDHRALRQGKMPLLNSVLYHSKSYDDFLLVSDMDELMVSLNPRNNKLVDVLQNTSDTACYFKLKSHAVPRVWNSSASTLAERMPYRCHGGQGAYTKSVAVVSNVNYLGLHQHSWCLFRGNRRNMPYLAGAAILHYTGLWKRRWSPHSCNITNEYTTFERAERSQAGKTKARWKTPPRPPRPPADPATPAAAAPADAPALPNPLAADARALPPPEKTPMERLVELKTIFEAGLVSEDEMQAKRDAILATM